MRAFRWQPSSFYYCLTEDALFRAFAITLLTEDTVVNSTEVYLSATTLLPARALLRSYLSKEREERTTVDSQRWRLARIIPRGTRLKRDLRGADLTLKAPRHFQTAFLHYRRGVFAANRACLCSGPSHLFRRGHEVYASPVLGGSLSLKERALKYRVEMKLPLKKEPLLFTDVDFLLNRGEFARAYAILQGVLRDLAIKRAATKAARASCVGRG
jgi:hypothetical protein